MTQTARAVSIFLALLALLALLAVTGCSPTGNEPASGLEEIADRLASEIERYPGTPRVEVIVDSSPDQPPTRADLYVRDLLLRLLAERSGDSFELVDRSELDRLFDEVELGQEGLSPEEERTELGRLAGIDLTVTCRVSKTSGGELLVEARLLELETQKFLAGTESRFEPPTDLALGRTEPTPAERAKALRSHLTARSPLAVARDEDQGWSIALLGCRRGSEGSARVFCVVRVENLRDSDRPFTVFLEQSRLLSPEGAVHAATWLLYPDGTATDNNHRPRVELVSKTPTFLVLGIDGVPGETGEANLELKYRGSDSRTFAAVTLEPAR